MHTAIGTRSTTLAFAAWLRVAEVDPGRTRPVASPIPAIIRSSCESEPYDTMGDTKRINAGLSLLADARRQPKSVHIVRHERFKPMRWKGRG
jgi:hypothetical protein